jgi:hypothetical protein
MIRLFSILITIGLATSALANQYPPLFLDNNSCEQPGRNPNLCYKMKSIKSLLNLLEGQDHLMQINYPYLDVVSENMGQVIDRVLVQMGSNTHMAPLGRVRTEVTRINDLAKKGDIGVFQAINQVRNKCQSCHAASNPTSGIEWGKMDMIAWEAIDQKCLKDGRNPMICKLMHGVASQVTFLDAVDMSQVRNFKTAEASAHEAIRIVDLLAGFKSDSSSGLNWHDFDKIRTTFKQVADSSSREDGLAYEIVRDTKKSCTQCHQAQQ